MQVVNKYCKIFTLSVVHSIENYYSLIGQSLFLIISLIIFSNLWELLSFKIKAISLSPKELLWYIALNEWVLIALPRPEREIELDLKSGKLAYTLSRPISYLGMTFCDTFGVYLVNLVVLGFVAVVFTYYQVGLPQLPPFSIVILVVTSVGAGIMGILFQMTIGISTFWVHEIEPFKWIWEKLLFALGGLMLPLSIYPKVLQQMALFTPFPWILGGRSALVFDYSIGRILMIFLGIFLWSLIGITFLTFLYRRGLKILQIEGG